MTNNINYEDEIDLKELFKTIAKNKKFIIIFTSIVTILSIIYVLLKTPIYEVKSNVQIGYIGKDLIAEPSTIVKILNIVFNVDDKIKSNEKFVSEVSSITTNKKLNNFIEIKTNAISNKEALKKNKEVVKYIQYKYKNKLEQYILNNNNKIKDLNIQIDNLVNLQMQNIKRDIEKVNTQDIKKIDESISFLKNNKIKSIDDKIKFHNQKLQEYKKSINKIFKIKQNNNATTTVISSMQIVNYQNLILNSQNKIEDLKLEKEKILNKIIKDLKREKENIKNDKLRKLEYKLNIELPNEKEKLQQEVREIEYNNSYQNIQNSKVIGNYIIKEYPIKPKKKLIVIVAFITGLILSIFLIFMIEFLKGIRENN